MQIRFHSPEEMARGRAIRDASYEQMREARARTRLIEAQARAAERRLVGRRVVLVVVLVALIAFGLGVTAGRAAAQSASYWCSVDISSRTRTTVDITLRNAGDGRCRFVTAHRCGRDIRMRRVVVLHGEHRVGLGIDCQTLRLRGLRAEVLQ
jgi:hypothetical protein